MEVEALGGSAGLGRNGNFGRAVLEEFPCRNVKGMKRMCFRGLKRRDGFRCADLAGDGEGLIGRTLES